MDIIIGLMGKPKAGKKTFIDVLNSLLAPDVVECIFSKASLDSSGEAQKGVLQRQITASKSRVVVFDVMRVYPDVELVKSIPQHCFVDIFATKWTRWQRTWNKGGDPGKNSLKYLDFLDRENTDEEDALDTFKQDELGSIITIPNFTDKEEFIGHIESFYRWHVEPLLT